ncbi:hypothetical protein ABTF13_20435, partial [Acinetobacter baumannii]
FSTVEFARLFQEQIVALCEKADHPLNNVMAVGSDLSAVSIVVEPSTAGTAYLRVAVGTESESEVESFCSILKLASIKVWQQARS